VNGRLTGAGEQPLHVVPAPRVPQSLRTSSPAPAAAGVPGPGHDQRRAPLAEAVERYRRRSTVSFHCPAHRGGRAADHVLRGLVGQEMLTADVWLDPAEQHRVRREAEDLAAALWGADRAFFLGNGSSGGNHAFLLATLRPGDEVVVARDAHVSTLMALVMTGARPVWITPDLHPTLDTGLGISPATLAATLEEHPRARLVVLVSPAYSGVCSDVSALADVAHAAGVPLFVDEAWGPHLPFHAWLPTDALAAGADAVVTSTHKLAGSLSQSALLLVRGDRLDVEAVATAVRMTASTSPLLPLLASIDTCRRRLALEGHALLDRALAGAGRLRERLARVPGVVLVGPGDLGLRPTLVDPLKVVLDVTALGRTGVEVDRLLRERCAVAVEGSDLRRLYLVVSPQDDDAGLDRLAAGLEGLRLRGAPAVRGPGSAAAMLRPRERAVSPRIAWFARSETVPLRAAVGRVAAELATPYPPGIPVLVPGEVVDAAQVAYLESVVSAGGHVHGAADASLATLRVMTA
jgi:lysine decarboxylase